MTLLAWTAYAASWGDNMGCTREIYSTVEEWNGCLGIYGNSGIRDEMCGCRPGSMDPVKAPPGRSLIDRLKDRYLGNQQIISVPFDFVGPAGPINTGVNPPVIGAILDMDARVVTPGEVVDGGWVPTLFWAPNKAASSAIQEVPQKYRVLVASVFPWLFWALVGGGIYLAMKRR